jgi:hypothetical protein
VEHTARHTDPATARIVQRCQELPGLRRPVRSQHVNDYLRRVSSLRLQSRYWKKDRSSSSLVSKARQNRGTMAAPIKGASQNIKLSQGRRPLGGKSEAK